MKEKVIKERSGDGIIYRNKDGKEISTYEEGIGWLALVSLSPLRDFLNMDLKEEDAEKILYIAQALLKSAEEKIQAAADYIEDNHGKVEIVRAMYHQAIDPETMLDIKYAPCKPLQE